MKTFDSKSALILSGCLLVVTTIFADNPIVQTSFTADPGPFVYKDVMYAYLGHDEDNAMTWFNMRDWRLYKTTDAANWTDLGVTATLATFAWARADAWASQVIERNGKFYYYTTLRLEGEPCGIGVAVADKPEGPFKDAAGKPLASAVGYIDPTVFIDDDGQAYLYFGNPDLYMVKLNADMISISGSVVKQTKPSCYTEAPWVYKRNGTYNIVYATNCNPGYEDIRHATSPTPSGPWTYRGIVQPVLNGGKATSWTNHPGIVEFKGKSYFFYHTGDLSGSAFRRSVQVEEFKYNTDGTIPNIPVTKEGPKQIGTVNPYDTVQAETMAWSQGLKTFGSNPGGIYVDSINNGDYIKVKGVDFGNGATSFEARVASGGNGGNIELHLDALTGSVVGTCAVSKTGGWQTWSSATCNVAGAKGVHDLYLKFTGASGRLFNFHWWKFTGVSSGVTRGLRGIPLRMAMLAGDAPSLRLDFQSAFESSEIQVDLFDLSGRLEARLFDGTVSSQSLTIPLRQGVRPQGIRILKLRSSEGVLLERTVLFP
ncbi:MAG: glycoside hydrolase family 43 protein [Fibrobacterota bacterium]